MKILRATLAALMLLALLAVPAPAQDADPAFSGAVTLDCYSDPEIVTVENTGDVPFAVDTISSLDDPEGDQSFDVSDVVGSVVSVEPGDSVAFSAGAPTANAEIYVLNQSNIFDDEDDAEGVRLSINTEGAGATPEVLCADGAGVFGDAPGPGPTEPPVPDDQQDMPDEMPDTGVGALGGAPLGSVAAAISVVVAGYALVRRR